MADPLREALADQEHERWARLMRYMLDKFPANADGGVTFPGDYVENLRRQAGTRYAALSEEEKHYDRAEADEILSLVRGSVLT
jgi:hypothetical protein